MNHFSELVTQVDKRIAAKVQKLVELLDDPDLQPYVAEFQHRFESRKASVSPIAPNGLKGTRGVREAVRSLEFPDPNNVTVNGVLDTLSAANFKFTSKDHARSVRDALYELSEGEGAIFKLVKKGEAGKASVYKRL